MNSFKEMFINSYMLSKEEIEELNRLYNNHPEELTKITKEIIKKPSERRCLNLRS